MNPTPPSPAYSELSDEELVRLMFSESDRLPMEFAREVISRGRRMIPALETIVQDRANWTHTDSGWWAVVHACFLLGSIGGEEAVKPLTEALFHATETDHDWVGEPLPSIFGALGPCALAGLKEIAEDPMWDWRIRERAMGGMAAVTLRHPEYEKEIFARIAKIMEDEEDDDEARTWAGHVLLDMGRKEYKDSILKLVEAGVTEGHYDADDVRRAFSKGKDLYWYQKDWLDFYSAKEMACRRERWERERLSEGQAWAQAMNPRHEDDDDSEGGPPLSRKGALEALGPDAAMARKIRDFLGTDEEEDADAREVLRRYYALAMELHAAIEKRDSDRLSAFRTFDIAIGRGDIMDWILDLPSRLAEEGLTDEGEVLAKAWSEIAEPENLLADRALILAEAGREGDARAQVQENLNRYPDDVWVQIKAGDAYYALKDFASAEGRFRKGLEMAEDDYDRDGAVERLIPLLRESGKTAEADALEDAEERRWEEVRARLAPHVRTGPKIGRNDPCPCGSGKKYKKCCLAKEAA